MAFFNAKGEPIVKVNVGTSEYPKKYLLYLDPAECKGLIDLIQGNPNALNEKIKETLLNQLGPL